MKKNKKHLTKEWKEKIGLANSIKMKEYWRKGRATQKQIDTLEDLKNTSRNKKLILGYVNSPETRKKLSNIMKEKIANGIIDIKKISPYIKGHKKGMLGKKHSQETKDKMKKSNKGVSDYTRKCQKEMRKHQVIPMKDTSIELKIQSFLKELKIGFFTHQYISIKHSYQCDILIPSMNLIIECDGNYWHGNPLFYPNPTNWQQEQINEDRIRTIELISKGFKVLRLWEHEIKEMDLNKFKEKLI